MESVSRSESYGVSLQIACVKTGDKYGSDYVVRLRNGVARHLEQPHEFVCYTDRPVDGVACRPLPADLPGWWSKVGLFKLGEPLVYFDLDVVITGDLKPLTEWSGFGILRDWWLPTFNSSVMVLTGNERHVFDRFTPADMSRCYLGDQQWITECLPDAATFPPEWFPSFKANKCVNRVPDGAQAVIFHGEPKPHQCGGWVKEHWV